MANICEILPKKWKVIKYWLIFPKFCKKIKFNESNMDEYFTEICEYLQNFAKKIINQLNLGKYLENLQKKIKLIIYWQIFAEICKYLRKSVKKFN